MLETLVAEAGKFAGLGLGAMLCLAAVMFLSRRQGRREAQLEAEAKAARDDATVATIKADAAGMDEAAIDAKLGKWAKP